MIKIIHLFFSLIIVESYCISEQQKIIIFSYGSLVVQKDNKKTGAQLQATPFAKTGIMVPISFTFIAGLPGHLITANKKYRKNYTLRRATATIDRLSQDYKPLWFAFSKKDTLTEALNNLAAREGAPKIKDSQYDITYHFYVKHVDKNYIKSKNEKYVPGRSNWITKKALHRRQQLSDEYLKKIVDFTIHHKAAAAIWVALPSHVTQQELYKIINDDAIFIKNTQNYIKKMPPENRLSDFEYKTLNAK